MLDSRTFSGRKKGIMNNSTNSRYLLNIYFWPGRVLSALPTLSQLKLDNSPKRKLLLVHTTLETGKWRENILIEFIVCDRHCSE